MSGLSMEGWFGVAVPGVFCSGVAYVFWYDALDDAGAGWMASFLYLEPLVTLVVAMPLLHETPALGSLFGGA